MKFYVLKKLIRVHIIHKIPSKTIAKKCLIVINSVLIYALQTPSFLLPTLK